MHKNIVVPCVHNNTTRPEIQHEWTQIIKKTSRISLTAAALKYVQNNCKKYTNIICKNAFILWVKCFWVFHITVKPLQCQLKKNKYFLKINKTYSIVSYTSVPLSFCIRKCNISIFCPWPYVVTSPPTPALQTVLSSCSFFLLLTTVSFQFPSISPQFLPFVTLV